MKRETLVFCAGLWVLTLLITPVQGQTAASSAVRNASEASSVTTSMLLQLTAEVKRLTGEVHQLQLELQGLRLRQLEIDLRESQDEDERLTAQENELNQVITDLLQQLGNSTLPAQERQTLEIARAELTDRQMIKLREAQQKAAERKAELSRLMDQSRIHSQELADRAKGLNLKAEISPKP